MATNYSKLLSLINGRSQTVDFSNINNILTLGGPLQFNGSTSGNIQFVAPATITSYSIVWPTAQAASAGYTLSNDGTGVLSWVPAASGSVSAVSVASANGFAGSSSGGTTPSLTISTSVTGILYGNGTAVSAAIPSNFPILNQNTTGTAANITATSNSTLTTLSALSLPTSQLSGDIDLTSQVVNILPVINGGTGVATASANAVFAGPASGSAAAPSFRALVAADIPSLSGSYANTALSNLASTTAINNDLLPGIGMSINLGSPTSPFVTLFADTIGAPTIGASTAIQMSTGILLDSSGYSAVDWDARQLIDASSNVQAQWSTAGFAISQALLLEGTTSGSVSFTATPVTTSYSIQWPAAQAAGSGYVLSNDGTGVLSWASPDSTGANTTLSNLTSPTSINQSLIPISDDGYTLGSSSAEWSTLYVGSIASTSSNAVINMSNTTFNDVSAAISADWNNRLLYDQAVVISIDWQDRLLVDTSGSTQLAWSTAGVHVNTGLTSPNLVLRGSVTGNLTQLTSATTTNYQIVWPSAVSSGSGYVLASDTSGNLSWVPQTAAGVSSVAFADDSSTPIYSVSGSPVTSTGTLAITLNTQAANSVFAGPSSGSAAQPSFRALVASDIPDISSNYVTQSEVGSANGVASLDGAGKVPISQLPNAVFIYQGTWDPSTNTPTLADGTGTSGSVYYVSVAYAGTVAGLTNPSMTNFQIGDLVIYNGSQYELTTPAAGVQSVNGMQGVVTVNAINQLTGDVTAGPASGSASAAATIATGAVTATKLGTVTDGITLDQSGAGSTLEVAAGGIGATQIGTSVADQVTIVGGNGTPLSVVGSTSFTRTLISSQGLAATTTYALRYSIQSQSETVNQVRAADPTPVSLGAPDQFWVIGLGYSASTISPGDPVQVTSLGTYTLQSSDTPFSTGDIGLPVFLQSTGAFSTTPPSMSGSGVVKLGIVTSTTTIEVGIQVMGVN